MFIGGTFSGFLGLLNRAGVARLNADGFVASNFVANFSGLIRVGASFTDIDGFRRFGLARIHGDPEIVTPGLSPGEFSLRMYTDLGWNYYLEYKSSLEETNWTLLQVLPGDSGLQTFSDQAHSGGTRFYRVRAE